MATMSDERVVEILNKSFVRGRNPSVKLLKGQIERFDRSASTLVMVFQATPELDNGNGQVMGGFLAAMMDVCVAQAVVVQSTLTQTVSTLEQKTSLLAPVRLSRKPDAAPVLLRCKATAIKRGKTVAFYEVSLSDEKGVLVAKATQTTLVINIPKHSPKPQAKL